MGDSKLDEYLRIYSPGEVIYEEGEVGDNVFLIKSGTVEVLKGEGAYERKLATLDDGEIVGEMALGKGEHERTATVKTVTEVEGWRFPGTAFESLIEQEENFRQKLFQSLVDRLIDTSNRLTDMENSEIKTLNRLLSQSAPSFLADLDSAQLEDKDVTLTKTIEHSNEFLAYLYDFDSEVIEAFRSLKDETNPADLNDELEAKVNELSRKIVEDASNLVEYKYPAPDDTDKDLVTAARSASKFLEKLEDHSTTYDNDKLQKIMEERKKLVEVLKEKKSDGRDDQVIKSLEKLLNGIKQEINIRYD